MAIQQLDQPPASHNSRRQVPGQNGLPRSLHLLSHLLQIPTNFYPAGQQAVIPPSLTMKVSVFDDDGDAVLS